MTSHDALNRRLAERASPLAGDTSAWLSRSVDQPVGSQRGAIYQRALCWPMAWGLCWLAVGLGTASLSCPAFLLAANAPQTSTGESGSQPPPAAESSLKPTKPSSGETVSKSQPQPNIREPSAKSAGSDESVRTGRQLLDDLFRPPPTRYEFEPTKPTGPDRKGLIASQKGAQPGDPSNRRTGGNGNRPDTQRFDPAADDLPYRVGRPAVSDARNRQGLLPDGALLIARPARAFTWHGTVYVRVSGQVMPVLPCEALSELLAALEQYRDPFFLLTIQVTTYRERNFALIRRADRLGAESVAAGLSADVMTLMTETETALGLAAVSGEPGAGRQQGPLLAIPIDDPEQAAFGAETLDSLRTSNIRAPLIRLTDRLRQAQRLGVSPQSLDAAELAKRPRPPGPGGSPSQTTSPPSGEPTIATKAGAGPGRIGPNVWYGESSAGDRTPRGVATVRQRESLDSQMAVPDVGGHGASDAASPADFLTNDPTRAKLIRGVREVPVRPDLDASETGTASQLAAATLPPRRRSANEMLGLNAPAGVGRGELDSQPRDEGALVLARSGRLVHTSDGALFYFDDQQPPIVVLPSAGLTTADVLSNYGRQRVKLRISGELTRHNQRNYLVLSRVIREPYDISERR